MSPGTRSLRVTAPQWTAKLAEHAGSQVQVVMKDGQTRFGCLYAIESERLILHDPNRAWYQRKRHSHALFFAEIQEIWIDEARSW